MQQQIPIQNQQVYFQNYGVLGNQMPNALPLQYQNIPNQYVNQGYIQNPQNIQQIQNPQNAQVQTENKRKTFTPGQYQKGKIVFQAPELIPRQPLPKGKNDVAISQHSLQKTVNPVPGQPAKNIQGMPFPQNPIPQKQIPGYPHPQFNPQQAYHNPQQVEAKPKQEQQKPQQNPKQEPKNPPVNQNLVKTATLMTVNTLSNLPYSEYEKAEFSTKPFYNISAYGFNSYNGKVRGYNEDRTKTIINYPKKLIVEGKVIAPRISYFGVFDGHGGEGCSNFLKEKLDVLLFNSKLFPAYPIQAVKEAFINAENIFMQQAIDKNRNTLVDKSGSCACVILIINDLIYAINLGDSRALLSAESGQRLRQITRDHKPNDPIEKARIEKSGAQVYYANKINVNGKEVILKESDYGGEGFKFPYRINPGGISVSFYL